MFLAFGKAPFALFCLAILSGLAVLALRPGHDQARPDLVFALFSKEHKAAYEKVIPSFEAKHGVKVQLQLIDPRTLQTRLSAALLSGAEVPDLVELIEPSIGYFTKGPLADVGFVDLTERIATEGLRERMVASRFALWSSRGRVFALPHDVHPVMLTYRRDLFEKLGITPEDLTTWDDVLAVGRKLSARTTGADGVPEHYLLDLPVDGSFGITTLLYQADGGLFDAQGRVRFDDAVARRVVRWYAQATRGSQRIAVTCGWGQSLARAAHDGRALAYLAPDWRVGQFEMDIPDLAGKFAVMPLPAWDRGGRRTSVMGGTGICITKASPKQDLAWALIKELYLREDVLGERFASTHILPPMRSAWDLPQLKEPNAFMSGQPVGSLYAALAPQAPEVYVSPYEEMARAKLNEAVVNVGLYYEAHGDDGLDDAVARELTRCADYVRATMARNRFLTSEATP